MRIMYNKRRKRAVVKWNRELEIIPKQLAIIKNGK